MPPIQKSLDYLGAGECVFTLLVLTVLANLFTGIARSFVVVWLRLALGTSVGKVGGVAVWLQKQQV
eukprot:4129386-Amphidinium_carterae.1